MYKSKGIGLQKEGSFKGRTKLLLQQSAGNPIQLQRTLTTTFVTNLVNICYNSLHS